jgi:hypothetical protein
MPGDSGEAPAPYHCRIGACRQLPKPLILVPVAAIQTPTAPIPGAVWQVVCVLDDVPLAKPRRGKPLIVRATPGPHSLMIGSKSRRTRSNFLHVDLNSADLHFKCEVNPGFSRMMFSNGAMQNFRLAMSATRNELAIIDLSSLDD